jgi:hypothetical protein
MLLGESTLLNKERGEKSSKHILVLDLKRELKILLVTITGIVPDNGYAENI